MGSAVQKSCGSCSWWNHVLIVLLRAPGSRHQTLAATLGPSYASDFQEAVTLHGIYTGQTTHLGLWRSCWALMFTQWFFSGLWQSVLGSSIWGQPLSYNCQEPHNCFFKHSDFKWASKSLFFSVAFSLIYKNLKDNWRKYWLKVVLKNYITN